MSMSVSVIADMFCISVLHDSLPTDLLIFLKAARLYNGDLSSDVKLTPLRLND